MKRIQTTYFTDNTDSKSWKEPLLKLKKKFCTKRQECAAQSEKLVVICKEEYPRKLREKARQKENISKGVGAAGALVTYATAAAAISFGPVALLLPAGYSLVAGASLSVALQKGKRELHEMETMMNEEYKLMCEIAKKTEDVGKMVHTSMAKCASLVTPSNFPKSMRTSVEDLALMVARHNLGKLENTSMSPAVLSLEYGKPVKNLIDDSDSTTPEFEKLAHPPKADFDSTVTSPAFAVYGEANPKGLYEILNSQAESKEQHDHSKSLESWNDYFIGLLSSILIFLINLVSTQELYSKADEIMTFGNEIETQTERFLDSYNKTIIELDRIVSEGADAIIDYLTDLCRCCICKLVFKPSVLVICSSCQRIPGCQECLMAWRNCNGDMSNCPICNRLLGNNCSEPELSVKLFLLNLRLADIRFSFHDAIAIQKEFLKSWSKDKKDFPRIKLEENSTVIQSFEHLFKESTIVMLTGDSGSGKSTLVQQFIYDWCDENVPYFDLILFVDAKDSSGTRNDSYSSLLSMAQDWMSQNHVLVPSMCQIGKISGMALGDKKVRTLVIIDHWEKAVPCKELNDVFSDPILHLLPYSIMVVGRAEILKKVKYSPVKVVDIPHLSYSSIHEMMDFLAVHHSDARLHSQFNTKLFDICTTPKLLQLCIDAKREKFAENLRGLPKKAEFVFDILDTMLCKFVEWRNDKSLRELVDLFAVAKCNSVLASNVISELGTSEVEKFVDFGFLSSHFKFDFLCGGSVLVYRFNSDDIRKFLLDQFTYT